ncbi:MAG: single-stranded-DNA-specific exonuclease RecJ [Patescibacteria group bacterium]
MKKKWKIKPKIQGDIKDVQLHPVLVQILLQRGITNKEKAENFFSPNYDELHDPFLFADMEKVVDRVKKAIKNQEIIGIFGDHDADGVSSATVLADGLEKLGLNVDVYIPDKLTEGHGINKKAINEFQSVGVTLMFSVDCGTSNVEAVDYANKRGMDVIITDHHHAPEILPKAYAIINPQLTGCKYPFKELSGTAVAFKVVQALFVRIAPEKSEQVKWLLDVVCVGTIADCMPLVDENRVLVKYGLLVLSKTQRIGYQEMNSVSNMGFSPMKIPPASLVAYQMGPRINAAGRMKHAKHAFELLRATTREEANKKAQMLEEQNLKRREITDKLTKEVEKIVENEHLDKSFILISGENYPLGIVGIIAGQIAQKYGKPTGIFTKLDDESRGSFRSVEGLHIVGILDECSEYLEKYGGHEQAAGAVIKNENFEVFCDRGNACVAKQLGDKEVQPSIEIDCKIKLKDVSHELVNQLKKLEPCGEGNAEPIFAFENLIIKDIREIGSEGKHLKMKLTDKQGSTSYDSVAFGWGYLAGELSVGDMISVATHIQENEWMGKVSIQFNLLDIQKNHHKIIFLS